jgi:hypothetical protein
MGAGDIAIKVVMDLSGVTRATSQFEDSIKSMTGAAEGASAAIGKIAMVAGTIAVAIGAVIAVVNSLKGAFEGLLKWGNQLDDLQNILGVNAQDAAKMALSMKAVGLSVDEGTTAFAYFARQVSDTDRKIQQTEKAITTAVSDSAEQQTKVATDLSKTRGKIASDLGVRISDIEHNLGKNIADMMRDNTRQLEAMGRDAVSIEQDAAKAMADVEAGRIKSIGKLEMDTAKSIAGVDKNLKEALRNANNVRERRTLKRQAVERKAEIMAEAAERRKEINEQADERRKDIDEQRNERRADLAERRALMLEEFTYRKQQAQEAAVEQIAQAKRASAEQVKSAVESSAEQSATIAKALDKQLATTREQLKNDPFMQAIDKMNSSLYDTEGKVKPVARLFEEMRTSLNLMPDGPDKTNIVMQLLGKSGKTFLDWLKLSTTEIDTIYEKNKAAYALSQEQIDQVKQLQISWAKIAMAVEGISMTIAIRLLPAVIELTQWVTENLVPALDHIAAMFGEGGALEQFKQNPSKSANDIIDNLFGKGFGTIKLPGMASGGYIPQTKPYLLHAGEYVLNPQQARALAPAMAGNSFNFSNTWNGNVSGTDRGSVEKWAEDAAYTGLRKALRGA